jgi:hypothetical protein
MVEKYPSSIHVPISALPITDPTQAVVADGERGDYSPPQAAVFAKSKLAELVVPCLYCSYSDWPSYRQATIDLGLPQALIDWWIAAYPGNGPVLYPGSIGHQYADRGSYDESVFLDGWQPGKSISAPIPPPFKGPVMQTAPFAFKPGQQDVLQVSFGTLWHKWNVAGRWYNEPISNLSGGVSGAKLTIPDQLPQVAVINGQCVVTIEDATQTVYYFAQSVNAGGWGVQALP